MQLQFLGATGTVTGSKYLLRHGDATILKDYGLLQSIKELQLRNWDPLPVVSKTIDAVVLTMPHVSDDINVIAPLADAIVGLRVSGATYSAVP